MNLTEEYIEEQRDVIFRCQKGATTWRKSKVVKDRHRILKKFCNGAELILSVGCAGLEPLEIKATNALDVHLLAKRYLEDAGWKGNFTLASCDAIPFPDRIFDVAVCDEVIEHLPDLGMVATTFHEINRVAKNWIVSTPAVKVDEPTHKRVFNLDSLKSVTLGIDCKIEKKGRYWYISK